MCRLSPGSVALAHAVTSYVRAHVHGSGAGVAVLLLDWWTFAHAQAFAMKKVSLPSFFRAPHDDSATSQQ